MSSVLSVPPQALHGWPIRRLEILRTPLRDLGVDLDDSVYAGVIGRVRRDLHRRDLSWMPPVYLSTGWHCPDRIPVVGVPFALATRELRRLEKEVTGQLESPAQMVPLLRHEVGHAYNYALGLYRTAAWRRLFGPITRPYREAYDIHPRSRQFVRHLSPHYAQKHPDEDFAETFAVWLLPRARWRREYAGWGALAKLEYVDQVMTDLAGREPGRPRRWPRVDVVADLSRSVARHYGRLGYPVGGLGFEDQALGFFDEDLKALFPRASRRSRTFAGDVLQRLRPRIVGQVAGVLGLRVSDVDRLYDKYVERSAQLGLGVGRLPERRILVEVSAMMTSHLLTRKHTGRFTRRPRLVGSRRR